MTYFQICFQKLHCMYTVKTPQIFKNSQESKLFEKLANTLKALSLSLQIRKRKNIWLHFTFDFFLLWLTCIMLLVPFYTPCKHKKISGFLFSRGIVWEKRYKVCYRIGLIKKSKNNYYYLHWRTFTTSAGPTGSAWLVILPLPLD